MKTLFKKSGLTLVESLVAISILILVVSGAYSAAQTGLSTSSLSKEQITAFYLAQEEIEALRNIRDENGLSQNPSGWFASVKPSCFASQNSNGCYIDIECWWDPSHSSCPSGAYVRSGNSGPLKINPVTGFYQDRNSSNSSWADSIYSRTIHIDDASPLSSDEVSVTVDVTWSKGAISRNFRIRENLLNWQY